MASDDISSFLDGLTEEMGKAQISTEAERESLLMKPSETNASPEENIASAEKVAEVMDILASGHPDSSDSDGSEDMSAKAKYASAQKVRQVRSALAKEKYASAQKVRQARSAEENYASAQNVRQVRSMLAKMNQAPKARSAEENYASAQNVRRVRGTLAEQNQAPKARSAKENYASAKKVAAVENVLRARAQARAQAREAPRRRQASARTPSAPLRASGKARTAPVIDYQSLLAEAR